MRHEALVPCKAESLANPNERGIVFEHPDTGDITAAIVPVNRVTIEEEPLPGGQVDGLLRVSVEKRRKSAVIDIEPAEMVQGDAKQKVPLSFIKEKLIGLLIELKFSMV